MEQTQERRVYNSLNPRPLKAKVFTLPSETIPDQTMSMRTLLERYAKGLPLEGEKKAIWEEEDEPSNGINPRTLDLVDFQEMKIDNELKINELQKKIKEAKDKKKAEKEQPEH